MAGGMQAYRQQMMRAALEGGSRTSSAGSMHSPRPARVAACCRSTDSTSVRKSGQGHVNRSCPSAHAAIGSRAVASAPHVRSSPSGGSLTVTPTRCATAPVCASIAVRSSKKSAASGGRRYAHYVCVCIYPAVRNVHASACAQARVHAYAREAGAGGGNYAVDSPMSLRVAGLSHRCDAAPRRTASRRAASAAAAPTRASAPASSAVNGGRAGGR